MKSLKFLALFTGFAAIAVAILPSQQIEGCAPAMALGVRVDISDETAIIVWDQLTKTEHFIRRATFATAAKDFGFLVPTPTQPDLGEVKDLAFKALDSKLREALNAGPKPGSGFGGAGAGGGEVVRSSVEVLDSQRVAGQDVVVLKATDVDALGKWLTEHKYDFSPALKTWLQRYVDAGWIITASKIARDKDGKSLKNVASSAVTMSFKTDKPFFPYSEPATQRDKQADQQRRLLRVYFVMTGKSEPYKGVFEDGKRWIESVESGSVAKTSSRMGYLTLTRKEGGEFMTALKLPADILKLPAAAKFLPVAVFEDWRAPRPGTSDVYFVPDLPEGSKKKKN